MSDVKSGYRKVALLLDLYPAGPVLAISITKTLISWDRLVLAELVND